MVNKTKDAPKKLARHQRYKDSEGNYVVGVTTAIGVLDKPAFMYWAWNLGMQGIDYKKYRDDKADIGTLAHDMVLCHYKGTIPDTSEYSKNQIDNAETCFLKYLDWEKKHTIEPILLEAGLVSEKHKFGGTLDMYAMVDGVLSLVDFKTSKGIYSTNFYQLAAYKQLLEENGHKVDNSMILRIGRDDQEGFEVRQEKNLETELKVFLKCVDIYYLLKETNKKYK
jgi:hypothetical protein